MNVAIRCGEKPATSLAMTWVFTALNLLPSIATLDCQQPHLPAQLNKLRADPFDR